MKTTTLIVGILLLLLGIGSLGYEGYITFSSKESTINVTDGQTTAGTRTTVPLRPIAGGLAAVCGFVLILVSNKKSAST
jgi:hypothetical protein